MAVAVNADDYTNGRVNIFFTANNNTPADGNLTGQCVTLLKWFFNDMCDGFPSPFAARGDARYVGDTLVNQGLAVEVNWAERRRGDIVVYEFGTYGHIALLLSGGRIFEENVNWPGVASEINSGGDRVYASRIGSEAESWRVGLNPHIYRINSYKEERGMFMVDKNLLTNYYQTLFGRAPDPDGLKSWIGQPADVVFQELILSDEYKRRQADLAKGGNCTTEERAYLDTMYKIVTKKG